MCGRREEALAVAFAAGVSSRLIGMKVKIVCTGDLAGISSMHQEYCSFFTVICVCARGSTYAFLDRRSYRSLSNNLIKLA